MPKLLYHSGPVAAFLLSPSTAALQLGQEGSVQNPTATVAHLRAVAMYALHLLGHPCDGEDGRTLYTAKFDPLNYTVTALPLEELLYDAFFERLCFGAVYNVWTGEWAEPKPADDLSRAVDRTHMMLAHGCDCIGSDIISQCGASVRTSTGVEDQDSDDSDDLDESQVKRRLKISMQEAGYSWQLAKYESICARYSSRKPPFAHFLERALQPDRRGLPQRDVLCEESTEVKQTSLCNGHHAGCGQYHSVAEIQIQNRRSINNLVFDFDKRSMAVRAWKPGMPHDDAPIGLDDPQALWTELENQMRSAGHSAETFDRYSVGLQEVLQDAKHSFHHAGGCGCRLTATHFDLSLMDCDKEDHATRVLVAVGAPESAFGQILLPGDVLIWTIYHGLAAL